MYPPMTFFEDTSDNVGKFGIRSDDIMRVHLFDIDSTEPTDPVSTEAVFGELPLPSLSPSKLGHCASLSPSPVFESRSEREIRIRIALEAGHT